jgi:hypothetical protein
MQFLTKRPKLFALASAIAMFAASFQSPRGLHEW